MIIISNSTTNDHENYYCFDGTSERTMLCMVCMSCYANRSEGVRYIIRDGCYGQLASHLLRFLRGSA